MWLLLAVFWRLLDDPRYEVVWNRTRYEQRSKPKASWSQDAGEDSTELLPLSGVLEELRALDAQATMAEELIWDTSLRHNSSRLRRLQDYKQGDEAQSMHAIETYAPPEDRELLIAALKARWLRDRRLEACFERRGITSLQTMVRYCNAKCYPSNATYLEDWDWHAAGWDGRPLSKYEARVAGGERDLDDWDDCSGFVAWENWESPASTCESDGSTNKFGGDYVDEQGVSWWHARGWPTDEEASRSVQFANGRFVLVSQDNDAG